MSKTNNYEKISKIMSSALEMENKPWKERLKHLEESQFNFMRI